VQPIANGALVLSIDTDFDGCMKLIRQVREGKFERVDLLGRRRAAAALRRFLSSLLSSPAYGRQPPYPPPASPACLSA